MHSENRQNKNSEKILLALLPFWEPQIPPLGIVSLRTFLEKHGYRVNILDANILETFSQVHREYFALLEACVPAENRGNFHNVGQDVLRNHLMAHLHREKEEENRYLELVTILVSKTFFVTLAPDRVKALNALLDQFYQVLETYFSRVLLEEKPTLLGLSVVRGNLAASLFAFKLAKAVNPLIRTVMGGAVFAGELAKGSDNLAFFLEKTPYIDKILLGEGELLFLKYLEGELPPEQRVYTLEDIGGETLDITSEGPPDFSGLNLEFYPNLGAAASRSCPFQCSFCTETVFWGSYRKKTPGQIREEMKHLTNRYRRQLFLMCDSLLNPIITPLATELIESGESVYFDGYLRADKQACNGENTLLWRRAGFYRARLGIESGSPHVLELMGKKISPEEIKGSITNLANAGIKTTTYWVVGHPGETPDDFQQTLDLIEELRDDIYEAWCSPFNFYLTGQVNSSQWQEKSVLLYPAWARELLIVQTWTLECEPTREEAYRRMNRFVRHCEKLGIPNPYTLIEFYHADQRWKQRHKNAVPALVEFENKDRLIDEHKYVKMQAAAQQKLDKNMGFDF